MPLGVATSAAHSRREQQEAAAAEQSGGNDPSGPAILGQPLINGSGIHDLISAVMGVKLHSEKVELSVQILMQWSL